MWNHYGGTQSEMRPYWKALWMCALTGTLAGAGAGLSRWSAVWPSLNHLVVARVAAVGWLGGVLVSPAVAYLVFRRRTAGRVPGPWRRAAGMGIGVLGLAPGLLWLNLAMPDSIMSQQVRVGRRLGDVRPNIILITIDALRADHVGAYGSSAGLTPNLDAFAREATRYDAAYASAPWTLTSFGAMFTARPPSECGLKIAAVESATWYTESARLPESVPLVSEHLRAAGYVTAAEITNPFLSEERGWARGFDFFRNEDTPNVHTLLTSLTERANTVTRNARLWLRLNPREPFFLWVHYLDPHAPYDSPDTPPGLRAKYPRDWKTGRRYWCRHEEDMSEETQVEYAEFCRAMYAEEVRYADRWVGELLKELERRRSYRRSLVVISSDHGEELYDHGGFDHGHTMHEEVLWVPLLVKWPEGRRCDERARQIVGLTDLAPTFLEAAGAEPMQGTQGDSLPTHDGPSKARVYSEGLLHGAEQTALTTAEHKIICHPHDSSGEPRFEVYDRRRDRHERHDLAGLDPAPALRERLWGQTRASHTAALHWHMGRPPQQKEPGLDEETRRKLQALGYVGE